MNNIKAIVLDIDGTLLNSEHLMSEKTKNILLHLQSKGIRIILASGRPPSGLYDIAHELDMPNNHGLLCSFNGSKVIDCKTREVLFNEPMSVELGKAVLEHMKNFKVIPMIDKDDYMFVNNVFENDINFNGKKMNIIEHEARGGRFKLCEQSDLAAFLDYRINKILTAGDPEYLQENYKEMMKPFENSLNCMFTAPFYFEFTALNIDKAKALDTALKSLGYSKDDIIAFGDGFNDISMVKYAGIGVAMANAVPELKAVANEITLSNDEDGIAHTLERVFEHML